LAKLSELNDVQLDKAFQKYKAQYRENPSEQLKKVIQQIDLELKKRKSSAPKSEPSKPKKSRPTESPTQTVDLSKLSQSASFLVKKSKEEKAKKEEKTLSHKLNKGQAPVISQKLTNTLLASGCLLILIGLILFIDAYWFYLIPDFSFKTAIYIIFITVGVVMMKSTSYLSDDNR